MHWYN